MIKGTPVQATLIDQPVMKAGPSTLQLALFLPDGTPFTPLEAIQGDSAYEVAVAEGFVGDEEAWLESLVGEAGADGNDFTPAAFQADFAGADLTALKVELNAFKAKLVAAGIMAAS